VNKPQRENKDMNGKWRLGKPCCTWSVSWSSVAVLAKEKPKLFVLNFEGNEKHFASTFPTKNSISAGRALRNDLNIASWISEKASNVWALSSRMQKLFCVWLKYFQTLSSTRRANIMVLPNYCRWVGSWDRDRSPSRSRCRLVLCKEKSNG